MVVYEKVLELLAAGKPFALASVLDSWGSTPQKAGAQAVFEAAGPVHGTIGGGCLEAESRRRALVAIDDGASLVFDLKLDEVKGWDDGLICGGKVRVFVTPDVQDNETAYRAMIDAAKRGAQGALVTVVRHPDLKNGLAMWVRGEDLFRFPWCDGEQIRAFIDQGAAGRIEAENGIELFVEPVGRPPHLIIAGAGHIGQATAHLGALLGFHVTIIDDRPAFANPNHVPDAHECICGDIPGELSKLSIDSNTYVVIVTRGHRHDGAVLAACVNSPARYIGMIGSKRKSTLIRKALVADDIATQEAVDRVVSPMGLDLGAQSVPEIAVSIAAQLVAVRRKGALGAEAMTLRAPAGSAKPI